MYLSQSYFGTPKTIRGNCNIIIFKKISAKSDLNLILRDYTLSLEVDELKKLYTECTREKLDWLMIKIDNPSGEQMYHNYTLLTIPGKEDESNKKMKRNESEIPEKGSEKEPEFDKPEKRESVQKAPNLTKQEIPNSDRQETQFKELQKLLHKFY